MVAVANATHEDGSKYTENPLANYKQDTIDNNAVDKIPGMLASEETEIMDSL